MLDSRGWLPVDSLGYHGTTLAMSKSYYPEILSMN